MVLGLAILRGGQRHVVVISVVGHGIDRLLIVIFARLVHGPVVTMVRYGVMVIGIILPVMLLRIGSWR